MTPTKVACKRLTGIRIVEKREEEREENPTPFFRGNKGVGLSSPRVNISTDVKDRDIVPKLEDINVDVVSIINGHGVGSSNVNINANINAEQNLPEECVSADVDSAP
ncbi:hypothetical protein ACJRO7_031001 [Eucalyptus globulus]|uniref:Uncharacterized protein n=1 Tax=Eucalyptus globulus TaxID=34317 RepID=A0ABD3JHF5_EUCGL